MTTLKTDLAPYPCSPTAAMISCDKIRTGTLQIATAAIMRVKGVPLKQSAAALCTHIAVNSVRTGYPIPVLLIENENGDARKLLEQCRALSDGHNIIDMTSRNQGTMFREPRDLVGKTIFAHDLSKKKKGVDGLKELLEKKMNGGNTNFVAVTEERILDFDSAPEVLVIQLPPDDGGINVNAAYWESGAQEHANETVASGMLRQMYSRATRRQLFIPYAAQITTAFRCVTKHAQPLCDRFMKLLCNTIIINNIEPETELELRAKQTGVTPEQYATSVYGKALGVSLQPQSSLRATKVDYYHAWVLGDIILAYGTDQITPDQKLVFESIRQYNFDYIISNGFGVDMESQKEKFSTLYSSSRAWATLEDIAEELHEKKGLTFQQTEIEEHIKKLIQRGLIKHGKHHANANRPVFYVIVDSITGQIDLPHPSAILDPVFEGRPAQVVNPLNGELVTI